MSLRLHIIVASTRPNRLGPAVADWLAGLARTDTRFDTHVVDLADFDLPIFNEPAHPRQRSYTHDKTRAWSESVAAADAFVFATPEYNHGPTPALVNALNYVYHEWNYKPAGFASYGGISGGLRGVEALKPTITTLKMVPLVEEVIIPMVTDHIRDGAFVATEAHTRAAHTMLGELHRWAGALASLRG